MPDEERYKRLQQRNAKRVVCNTAVTSEVNVEGEGNNVETLDGSDKGAINIMIQVTCTDACYYNGGSSSSWWPINNGPRNKRNN